MLSGLIALPYLIHLVRASFSDITFSSPPAGKQCGQHRGLPPGVRVVSGSMIVANAQGPWDRSVTTWPAARTLALVILAAALAWAVVTVATTPHPSHGPVDGRGGRSLARALSAFGLHLQHFYSWALSCTLCAHRGIGRRCLWPRPPSISSVVLATLGGPRLRCSF